MTIITNAFEMAQSQFDHVAEQLNLEPYICEMLRWPMREFTYQIPIRTHDDTIRVFYGYRVQHNDARGPAKGGIRFHPSETLDTIRALAMWMTWKCAVGGYPPGWREGRGGSGSCQPDHGRERTPVPRLGGPDCRAISAPRWMCRRRMSGRRPR